MQVSPKNEDRRQSGESAASSSSALISSPEMSMHTQLSAVQAVILVRDSPDATHARVLLPGNKFPRRDENPEPVRDASDLAQLARARAETELGARVSQNVLVFDTLPIPEGMQPPPKLRAGTDILLADPLNELENTEQLRVVDGTPKVKEFYVLVTRLHQNAPQGTLQDVIDQVRERIKSVLPATLGEVELFELPDGSPYQEQLTHLAVPKHPMHTDEPHLLMEGLTGHENDGSTASQLLDKQKKDDFYDWCQGGPGVMLGVTGIGKTRAMCEYLAKHYGLYFVANTEGNGGIKDFASICTQNFVRVKTQQKLTNRDLVQQRNGELARLVIRKMLLVRLLILDVVLEKYGKDECTPLKWLWLQLYPDYLLATDNRGSTSVVINELFSSLWHSLDKQPGELSNAIAKYLSRIGHRTTTAKTDIQLHQLDVPTAAPPLTCFVDEAQIFLTAFGGHSFPSESSSGRPLFTEVCRVLSEHVRGPIMGGTGIGMQPAMKALATGLLKQKRKAREWSVFPGLDTARCQQYLEARLGAEAVNSVPDLAYILHGRPRFSANFVHTALLSPDRPTKEVFDDWLKSATKNTGTDVSDKDSVLVTVANAMSKLAQNGAIGNAVVDLFKAVTLRYNWTGLPQDILEEMPVLPQSVLNEMSVKKRNDVPANTRKTILKLMETGVCPILRTTDYQMILDEPLVARAAANHFGIVSSSFALMRELKDTPSAMGFEFEKCCAGALASDLVSLFDGTTPLEQHKLLRSVKGIEIFGGVWEVVRPNGAHGRTLARVATPEYQLTDFLADGIAGAAQCTFFFPATEDGPDVFFFAVRTVNGDKAIASIQDKLIGQNLSGEKAQHAVDTVSRAKVIEKASEDALKTISIVLSYPAALAGGNQRFPTQVTGKHLFINGGGNNFEALFPNWFYRNLRALKSKAAQPEVGDNTKPRKMLRGKEPNIKVTTLSKESAEDLLNQDGFLESELPAWRVTDIRDLLRVLRQSASGDKYQLCRSVVKYQESNKRVKKSRPTADSAGDESNSEDSEQSPARQRRRTTESPHLGGAISSSSIDEAPRAQAKRRLEVQETKDIPSKKSNSSSSV